MADTLPTTEPFTTTVYGFGTSNSARKGFQQTAGALPAAADVWGDYFDNVMRGDTDTFGDTTTVSANRTFSSNGPPEITSTHIGDTDGTPVGNLGGGEPDGGFVPTSASPGEGNGVKYSEIPELDGLLVEKLVSHGAGSGENGSVRNPQQTSAAQSFHGKIPGGISPNYPIDNTAGGGAWSGA